jgi:hypothetical protein
MYVAFEVIVDSQTVISLIFFTGLKAISKASVQVHNNLSKEDSYQFCFQVISELFLKLRYLKKIKIQ